MGGGRVLRHKTPAKKPWGVCGWESEGLLEDNKKKAKLSMSLNPGDLLVRKRNISATKKISDHYKEINAFRLQNLRPFSGTEGGPRHWN